MADGEPLLLEQVFLPEARFPGLLAGDLEGGSLYELLGERYDTRVVRARESLEPISMPPREAQLLGVDAHRPALRIEGLAYDRSGRPVEFAAVLRPGRPDPLLRGAGRRPLEPPMPTRRPAARPSAAFAATRPT